MQRKARVVCNEQERAVEERLCAERRSKERGSKSKKRYHKILCGLCFCISYRPHPQPLPLRGGECLRSPFRRTRRQPLPSLVGEGLGVGSVITLPTRNPVEPPKRVKTKENRGMTVSFCFTLIFSWFLTTRLWGRSGRLFLVVPAGALATVCSTAATTAIADACSTFDALNLVRTLTNQVLGFHFHNLQLRLLINFLVHSCLYLFFFSSLCLVALSHCHGQTILLKGHRPRIRYLGAKLQKDFESPYFFSKKNHFRPFFSIRNCAILCRTFVTQGGLFV